MDAYRAVKRDAVERAIARHHIHVPVGLLLETAPATRRRAALRAQKSGDTLVIGFNALRSHAVVDMQECAVLTPALLVLVGELREVLRGLLKSGQQAKIAATETDTGFDLSFDLPSESFARQAAVLAQWARARNVARVSINGEIAVHLCNPVLRIGDADLVVARDMFLQPSREGERILQAAVLEAMQGVRNVADLFAGCGTFALVLAQRARVHAVDLDHEALGTLSEAARKTGGLKRVSTEARDLFKRPLRSDELKGFGAVVIDPPRAGARAQVQLIAQSQVERLAYVSCNPETFARDAAILVQGGFHPMGAKPVDQFLWSKHIELVGVFERKPEWSQRRRN